MLARRIGLSLVPALVAAALLAASARAAGPVPSLTPAATQAEWSRLADAPRPLARGAECVPLRVVFYAATDWVRLATRLAANGSSCVQYFISVPPLADKVTPRPDQARRFRALGPNFHGLAEINVSGWTDWVAANGASWYAAGVEARKRMAENGYDVASGDSWALNELSSAVRVGTGTARANTREFLRGLYDGGGNGAPAVKGVVFTTGLAQVTTELSVYQSRLQDWFEDAAFWTDMQAYVSDWSQEQYGDVRNYAVAGADPAARRTSLNEYLQHALTLARVSPATAAAARAFLEATYSPLGNAAWEYDTAFGYTSVSYDLMADYVSAQVDALRTAGPRFGFAWAPRNATGMPAADFTAQTAAILDRLAAAIADGASACAPPACTGVLSGASFNPGWQTFAQWKPSVLAFSSPPQTLVAGAASQPLTLELRTNTGLPLTAGVPLAVTVATSSAGGGFAASAAGPWTSTLALTLPSGASSATVYYRDTQLGTATVTATAAGKAVGAQQVTVTSAPDTVAPETAIAARPAARVRATTATFRFAAEPGVRYECSLDGAPYVACNASLALVALRQGRHTLAVRAIDAAGNVDASPARHAWVVDTVAPDTRIVGQALRLGTARFWFTAREPGVRYQCSLDGRRFSACRSAQLFRPRAGRPHTFRVRAVDALGNVEQTPASTRWITFYKS
jgi:hypothetical protein